MKQSIQPADIYLCNSQCYGERIIDYLLVGNPVYTKKSLGFNQEFSHSELLKYYKHM